MAATSEAGNVAGVLLLRLLRLHAFGAGKASEQTLMGFEGFEILLFSCVACGAQDYGNVELVVSVRVKRDADGGVYAAPDGQREPLCRQCAARANENRVADGMEPFFIHPDAYAPRETI